MQLHAALFAERIIISAILPRVELLLVARMPPSIFLPRCISLATPAGRLETLEWRFAFLSLLSRENRNVAAIFRRRFSQRVIAPGETFAPRKTKNTVHFRPQLAHIDGLAFH
jgi:hypothetical protein